MNFYEIVYIVHPALQAGHLDDTVNQINKKLEQLKGEIVFFENWGKKKLSYMIQKQKYGTYILFQCKINGQNINELTSEFEHNTNILRHLIGKITEDKIMKQKFIDEDVAKRNLEKKNDKKIAGVVDAQQDLSKEKIEETKVKETQVEEGQVEETQVEEGQVEETKVEETKVEEGQVEETKVEEGQVEETQVEETKVEETKVEEGPVETTDSGDKKIK